MSLNPSKILESFFGIDRSEISAALLNAEDDAQALNDQILSLNSVPFDERTPEVFANIVHLRMVRVHELCRQDSVAPELKTFDASLGAEEIAGHAESVANDKGELAKMISDLRSIESREGLGEDDFFEPEDEPHDHRQIFSKWLNELERIKETIFVEVLRRYKLDDVANLYESNRNNYDIQREIGRRVYVSSDEKQANAQDPEGKRRLDEFFIERYGENALRHVRIRVAEILAQQA